jgi:hypothetical protein
MSKQFIQHSRAVRPSDWLSEIDLIPPTEDLTSISARIAKTQFNCKVYLNMLDTHQEELEKYSKIGYYPSSHLTDEINYLTTGIGGLKAYLESIKLQSQYYAQRAEAQRQTLYTMRAQKDNLLNSNDAQASRADSTSMALIANSTAQDSANMVAISVVTLLFLRATFTATSFSTSFFEFNSN